MLSIRRALPRWAACETGVRGWSRSGAPRFSAERHSRYWRAESGFFRVLQARRRGACPRIDPIADWKRFRSALDGESAQRRARDGVRYWLRELMARPSSSRTVERLSMFTGRAKILDHAAKSPAAAENPSHRKSPGQVPSGRTVAGPRWRPHRNARVDALRTRSRPDRPGPEVRTIQSADT